MYDYSEIKEAAKKLEKLINQAPAGIVFNVRSIDVTTLSEAMPRKLFSFDISTTSTTQIYP